MTRVEHRAGGPVKLAEGSGLSLEPKGKISGKPKVDRAGEKPFDTLVSGVAQHDSPLSGASRPDAPSPAARETMLKGPHVEDHGPQTIPSDAEQRASQDAPLAGDPATDSPSRGASGEAEVPKESAAVLLHLFLTGAPFRASAFDIDARSIAGGLSCAGTEEGGSIGSRCSAIADGLSLSDQDEPWSARESADAEAAGAPALSILPGVDQSSNPAAATAAPPSVTISLFVQMDCAPGDSSSEGADPLSLDIQGVRSLASGSTLEANRSARPLSIRIPAGDQDGLSAKATEGPPIKTVVLAAQTHLPPSYPLSPMLQIAACVAAETGGDGRESPKRTAAGKVKTAVDSTAVASQAVGAVSKILNLRLEPAHLGSVTIRMRLRGASLGVEVEADQSETARLLVEGKDVLIGNLQSGGYVMDMLVIRSTSGSGVRNGDMPSGETAHRVGAVDGSANRQEEEPGENGQRGQQQAAQEPARSAVDRDPAAAFRDLRRVRYL